MRGLLRQAWWELSISLLAAGLAAAIWPWLGVRSTGFFGLLGFMPLGQFYFRRAGSGGETDERDRSIELKANVLGVGAAFYGTFLGAVVLTLVYESAGTVPVVVLSRLLWGGFALVFLAKSLAVFWCYRRDPV
jgi:hypothetical protein